MTLIYYMIKITAMLANEISIARRRRQSIKTKCIDQGGTDSQGLFSEILLLGHLFILLHCLEQFDHLKS